MCASFYGTSTNNPQHYGYHAVAAGVSHGVPNSSVTFNGYDAVGAGVSHGVSNGSLSFNRGEFLDAFAVPLPYAHTQHYEHDDNKSVGSSGTATNSHRHVWGGRYGGNNYELPYGHVQHDNKSNGSVSYVGMRQEFVSSDQFYSRGHHAYGHGYY